MRGLRQLARVRRVWQGLRSPRVDAMWHARFVFGDLKPENILVTATGHAKITDFGAVRP